MSTDELTTRFAVKFFLSYESLKTRKRRIFLPTSYIQGQEVEEAKEAVESARAGMSQKRKEKEKDQGRWSVATRKGREKKKKKKKKTKEGEKVAPPKAMFRVPSTKKFLFLVHEYLGYERPILVEVSAPASYLYKEAMCEGSSGNGLLYAAKAVP